MGYQRLETGLVGLEEVFIKVTNMTSDGKMAAGASRDASDISQEIAMAQRLGDAGVAPKFVGTQVTDDGYIAIVTRNEPGFHVDSRLAIDPSQVTPQHIDSILSLADKVDNLGGMIGRDVQIRLTQDGRALLVDLEGISASGNGFNNVGDQLREMASGLLARKIEVNFHQPEFTNVGISPADAKDLFNDSFALSKKEQFNLLRAVEKFNPDQTVELLNVISKAYNDGGGSVGARQALKEWFQAANL